MNLNTTVAILQTNAILVKFLKPRLFIESPSNGTSVSRNSIAESLRQILYRPKLKPRFEAFIGVFS